MMDSTAAQKSGFVLRCATCVLHWIPLAVLTILAGVLRFARIDHPCLWYDESMVFWRTCGSYGQLLDCLRTDGFVPLHYSLVWVITRFVRPTPLVLRFVPALSGTLMVPAIYFLARELVVRKTALLAAALAACSAFTLFYSRDAKMYMDSWFFVTLNLGCLHWWFRCKSATAWLCWIASGCAACGLHISSAIPIALSLLLLFTQDKMHWRQTLLWLAGALMILSGPIGHYEKFNVWKERVDENWNESGLQWISVYNYGRTGPELLRYLGTTLVMGWEWPKRDDIAKIPPERFDGPSAAAGIILAILIAGCLPWPRNISRLAAVPKGRFSIFKERPLGTAAKRENRHHQTDRESEPAFSAIAPVQDSYQTANFQDPPPQPRWRVLLWLAILTVLPVYGFYCRSMSGFVGPWDWLAGANDNAASFCQHFWWFGLLVLLMIGLRMYIAWRQKASRQFLISCLTSLLRTLGLVAVAASIIAICWVMAQVMATAAKAAFEAGKPWESVWVPRYIGFIWPALVIAIAAIIARLPTRPVRIAVILFVLGINLTVAGIRIFGQTEPPVDLMARDLLSAQDPSHHILIRLDIAHGTQAPGGANLFSGTGEYYVDLISNTPTDPSIFKRAILLLERANRGGFPARGPINIPADIDRVIVWNQYSPIRQQDQSQLRLPHPGEDLLRRLYGWHLASESVSIARSCWTWEDQSLYRRREYIKTVPSPAR